HRTKTLAAYGEIVWSWRRDRGVKLAGPAGDGGKKRRSPGRARISRKTIARGKPGCPGCTCQNRVHSSLRSAHGAAGPVGARLSLRPLRSGGTTRLHNSGKSCRGNMNARAANSAVVPDKRANGSRECAPDDRLRERDPGSITTGLSFAKAGAPASS